MLKLMNRPYSRERYLEIVDSLRNAVPDMYFSTDIIVGFPGETDEEFEDTCTLFEEVAYDMAFIFKYSIRTGTPAANMGDQIPQEVKEARNQRLLDLLRKSSLARNESLVGTTQEVLIEGKAKRGELFQGKTRGYRNCLLPASDRLVGEIVQMKVNRATQSSLYGDLVLSGIEEADTVTLSSSH